MSKGNFNFVVRGVLGAEKLPQIITQQYQRLGGQRYVFDVDRSYNAFCNQMNSKNLRMCFRKNFS